MQTFNKILCLVEPNEASEHALACAYKLSIEHKASLVVATLAATRKISPALFVSQEEKAARLKDLAEAKKRTLQDWCTATAPDASLEIRVLKGSSLVELVRCVMEEGVDLVVKCADDPLWLTRLFGSNDMHLLRECPCPVLMMKPGHDGLFQNIMATVDVNGDEEEGESNQEQHALNERVLDYAAAVSVPDLSNLHVTSVWEALGEDFMRYSVFSSISDEQASKYVEQTRRECESRMNTLMNNIASSVGEDVVKYLSPQTHLVKGVPGKEIPELAKKLDIDLIVMGTVARTGIPGFVIGNTAEDVLEQVNCSVLAVKPEGFESQVKECARDR